MDDLKIERLQKIGARIRETRIQKNMSQQELAAQANISVSQMSDIERGRTAMRITTFVQIVEVLQVSTDSLLRTNSPQTNEIYQSEFSELLKDCSPMEIDSILNIAREVKATIRKQNTLD